MKGLLYLLCRTVYFLNCVAEVYSTYSIYLAFWQIYDLTLETNHLHFPKSANTICRGSVQIFSQIFIVLASWRYFRSGQNLEMAPNDTD